MRKWINIFWIMVVVLFGIFFISAMGDGLQRIEKDKDICSEHNMSSLVINRSMIVLCVDNKGQVFYLRNVEQIKG
ncbi:hypothetical protein LCGC14_1407300 [marine sediment metagenome]|uniref:Uncharacterized protein n=2 Tax=marine sediment metagenome TaxID=412755 RepID=A0A0F9MAL1_9ZZZZ